MEHRPTLIFSILLLVVLLLLDPSHAYSKYGRSCSDIGCLSSETCVMAHDSCSYNQRENKDCGRYPTCRKTGSSSAAAAPGAVLNAAPENTRPVSSNYNPNFQNSNIQPASAPQNPYPNIYPQIPGGSPPQYPQGAGQYPPQVPSGNAQYPQYPGQYGGQNPPPAYPGQYPGYQQPGYGNQPPPYSNSNPYNPYANPQGAYGQFPNYRNIPTTTEPSLWNQFLHNKGGRNYYGNAAQSSKHVDFLTTTLALFTSILVTRMLR